MLSVFIRPLFARALLIGFVFGFVGYMSFAPAGATPYHSSPHDTTTMQIGVIISRDARTIWPILSPRQQQMVDRLAADFFETKLSLAQRQRIIAVQAHAATHHGTARPPHARKTDANQPSFTQLTKEQKRPFRQYGIDQLGIRVEVPTSYLTNTNKSI